MTFVYLMFKLYPFFGVSLGVVSLDLLRNYRRKGIKVWLFYAFLAFVFFTLTIAWIVFRGDLHSEEWFNKTQIVLKQLF